MNDIEKSLTELRNSFIEITRAELDRERVPPAHIGALLVSFGAGLCFLGAPSLERAGELIEISIMAAYTDYMRDRRDEK